MTPPTLSAQGRLAQLGFADTRRAEAIWSSVGLPDDGLLQSLAAAADPDLALTSLARLLAADGQADATLRSTLATSPLLGRRLSLVMGASSALADHLVAHPADVRELADDGLGQVRPTAAALVQSLGAARDRNELRRIYRRLLLRLAARDLSLEMAVDDVAAELADLAAATLEGALVLARRELGASAALCQVAVIGMGKCGGRELNYVSDVDVIFVAEPVNGAEETLALKAASAMAAALMRICDDHTREGTLWPVDANLRPEGRAGPLVRTLSSHAMYYGRWAKTWEFQALLKARPVAGDLELGERYVAMVQPLIWQAADRPDFVHDVQAMRRRVVDRIRLKDAERELKLGPGGLRDVEFAVQLLQLVHGRSDSTLASGNTLCALQALIDGGYVGRDDGAALASAYRFLRTLEHRLQLSHLRRTHQLPDDHATLRKLARSIGLSSADALLEQWRQHGREVRRLHEKLFYRPLLQAVAALPRGDVRLTTDAARQRLEALGYADPGAALRHLEALTAGVSRRAAIQRTLLPVMLGWFAETPDPDAGLLGFRRLSDALGRSPWYLRMLRDEGVSAERLAHLLGASRFATDLLLRAPEATGLLAHDADLMPRSTSALVREATQAAQRQHDAVEAIAAVRALRRRELLRVAAADIFGLVDLPAVGEALSSVATATLAGGLTVATTVVEEATEKPLPTRLAVIAMGRLGGCEMSYASDADVLFVHDPLPGTSEQEASEAAFAVANEMRRLLGLPGAEPVFLVDAALRPEGRQGPLVRSLASYRAYYERWAKIWEAQALLRARPVAGDEELGLAFIAMVDPVRYRADGLTALEVQEIRRIKARVDVERLPRGADPSTHVKLGRGGLTDVEWTVQLLQLRNGARQAPLRTTRTLEALQAAVDADLVSAPAARALRDTWTRASRVRNATMLVRGRPSDSLPTHARDLAAVARLCGYDHDAGRLSEDYRRNARRAASVVDEVFWT